MLYRPNRAGETPYNIDLSHQKTILGQIFGARKYLFFAFLVFLNYFKSLFYYRCIKYITKLYDFDKLGFNSDNN